MIDCRPSSLIRILCVWELRAVSISTRLLLVSRNVIERFITLLVRKNPLLLIVKAITVAFRIICRSPEFLCNTSQRVSGDQDHGHFASESGTYLAGGVSRAFNEGTLFPQRDSLGGAL